MSTKRERIMSSNIKRMLGKTLSTGARLKNIEKTIIGFVTSHNKLVAKMNEVMEVVSKLNEELADIKLKLDNDDQSDNRADNNPDS